MKKQIKQDLLNARREKNDVTKSILSVLIGEIQLVESRTGKELSDEAIIKLISKLIKSNNDTLKYPTFDKERINVLESENETLAKYVPKELVLTAVFLIILGVDGLSEELQSSDNPMKLMGRVMGIVKQTAEQKGYSVNGAVVKEAIIAIAAKK